MSSQANGNRGRRKRAGGDTQGAIKPTLSVHRAFVVQFREQPERSRRAWQGRAEHIASGRSVTFTSRTQLLAFLSPAPLPYPPATNEKSVITSTKEERHVS